MLLLAMAMKSHRVFAQSVTVTLMPGWTWISCPSTDTLDFATALGSFTPAAGDVIESQFDYSEYIDGEWFGGAQQFYPGYGYLYFSNRNMPVFLTFNTQQPAPQVNDHEYVDLGLPSGTLWATCNVGANAPEEYGDYFAWGETNSKLTYNWNTYLYCNGSNHTLTKYCNRYDYGYNGFADNKTTLLSEDDAAQTNWNENWRMPTKEEWLELYQNTTNTMATQNGVNGWLFTASNGNSLFLPAAGYRSSDLFFNAGEHGYYWSSSLNLYGPDGAWGFLFHSEYDGMFTPSRDWGMPVRPVCSAPQD